MTCFSNAASWPREWDWSLYCQRHCDAAWRDFRSIFSRSWPRHYTLSESPLYYVPDSALLQNAGKGSHPMDKEDATGNQMTDDRGAKLHILVTDDSMANRKLLQKLLERRGHTCILAADGRQAVDLVRESLQSTGKRFDMILLDCEMPTMVRVLVVPTCVCIPPVFFHFSSRFCFLSLCLTHTTAGWTVSSSALLCETPI